MAIDRKNRCPNCGATLTGLELKCPECGYTLSSETAAGEKTTESILALQDKLAAVDKVFSAGASASKKKATIINAFPIPNTASSLLRLLHLSYSNYEASKESGDKRLMIAWLGKSVESYRRLCEMREEPSVAQALQKYGALADSNAFSKLTGSYTKKRLIAILSSLFVVLLCALVYFWGADILAHTGHFKGAVKLLNQTGRKEKVIDLLIENEKYEEAATLMYQKGQLLQSVAMLSQKGYIKQALILAGKTGTRDSIDMCLDEIAKFCTFGNRTKYYLQDNYAIIGPVKYSFYNHDRFRYREESRVDDDATIWFDAWGIYKDMDIPQPHFFYDSDFLFYYRTADLASISLDVDKTEVIRNGHGKIIKVIVPSWGMVYEFEYDRYGNVLTEKGSVLATGKQYSEVSYFYHDLTQLLSSVHVQYLFDDRGNYRSDKYDSYTINYLIKEGRLIRAVKTMDYNDLIVSDNSFEYYENTDIINCSDYSDSTLKPSGAFVYYHIDDEIIEQVQLIELK